jgi:hypothetical protein
MGLKGSATFSTPDKEISPLSSLLGAGVEKSIRRSSAPCLLGDLPLPVLRFRSSSNVGIALGGVRGMVGLRIDLIAKGVEVYQ